MNQPNRLASILAYVVAGFALIAAVFSLFPGMDVYFYNDDHSWWRHEVQTVGSPWVATAALVALVAARAASWKWTLAAFGVLAAAAGAWLYWYVKISTSVLDNLFGEEHYLVAGSIVVWATLLGALTIVVTPIIAGVQTLARRRFEPIAAT